MDRRTSPFRLLLVSALLAIVASSVAVGVTPSQPALAAGERLFAGNNVYSQIINCISIIQGAPYPEAGVGAYAGFYADPEAGQPAVNQTFYVELLVVGMGNSCGGQRFSVELLLPAGVTTAISAGTPVRCFAGTSQLGTNECPQSLIVSPFTAGALYYPSIDTAHANTWPAPQGAVWTFRFPVRSSGVLSGVNFGARLQVLDGWDNPVLQAVQPLFVFNGAATSVLYPNPSTTFVPVPNSGNFTVKSTAYIYKPVGQTGTGFFDIATNPSFSPVLFTDSGAIPANLSALEFFTNWVPGAGGTFAIQPNTTYYWRTRYQPSSGTAVTGATQSFRTPTNGNNVVGTGTAASCTIEALEAAFNPFTTRVAFNCGPLPVSFQLRDSYVTGGPLEIDGGGKVTLIAQPNQRIFRHEGGSLTLKGITLTGGNLAGGCGGALQVFDGSATLANVRITNSSAEFGGGLCTMATTSVSMYDSAVLGNTATSQGGGIYNGGFLSVYRSEVSNNTATTNGGGAYTSASAGIDLFYSTVAENRTTSPTGSGGGLHNAFNGQTYAFTSTVSSNTSAAGAGVMSFGTTSLTASTLAFNVATGSGAGGFQAPTSAGAVQLGNTLIAGNSPSNCIIGQQFTLDRGNNLSSDNTCNLNEPGDITNVNPQLRPLGLNGGGTRTHALRFGSPAVDAGTDAFCAFYDQRGVHGPEVPGDVLQRQIDGNRDGVLTCDIGSFELEQTPDFTPITPARFLESRPANGATNPTTGLSTNTLLTLDGESQNLGLLPAGSTTQVRIAGRGGIPLDALAASLNVAATSVTTAGFVRVFPCGESMPSTATVNAAAGATVSNASVVALGGSGKVCVFVSQSMNVIIDVNGYMPAGSRVGTLRPARIADTRVNGTTDDGIAQRSGLLVPQVPLQIPVRGRLGIPANATAVVVNVAALNATASTFVTVYGCGSVPSTSNVNLGAGGAVGNLALVPLSASGALCVVANQPVNVILDATAYLTPGSTVQALTPARLLDSRPGVTNPPDDGVNTVRPAGSETEIVAVSRGGVSPAVKVVAVNVTAIAPAANGFVTIYACGTPRPATSNLNYVAGVTRGNMALVAVPSSGPKTGRICVFTSQQTNLAVDVLGQVL